MSAIEDEVLKKFEDALENSRKVAPRVAKDVLHELASEDGPNSERLAELFKKAIAGGSK
jgi:hypothetical protein